MTFFTLSTLRIDAVLPIAVSVCLAPALCLGQTRPQNPKQLDATAVYAAVRNTVVVVEARSATGHSFKAAALSSTMALTLIESRFQVDRHECARSASRSA
jgi:hypothetical protein